MDETVQTEESTSFLDILKLLWSKIHILIIVVIIAGILGGGITALSTVDINYWGTTVEFYVNPEKPKNTADAGTPSISAGGSQYGVYGAYGRHVMDNMVKLLGSEIFAERLLLDGEDLPEKNTWVNTSNEFEVSLGLDGLIDAAISAQTVADEKQAAADLEHAKVVTPAANYAKANSAMNFAWAEYKKAHPELPLSVTFNENEYENLKGQTDTDELDKAYTEWKQAKDALASVQAVANAAQKIADEAQTAADDAKQSALEAWRQTKKYKNLHGRYKAAVSFSYLEEKEDIEDANNLARSFIYVKISVLDDKDFATTVLERVKKHVPEYIEDNMAIPDGYEGTNCQKITTGDFIDLTNPGYATNESIKFAILSALIAAVIACIVIIIVDKSDKRLRDTDSITKIFNVPVLGIVPTIEELVEESAKKNAPNSEGK